MNQRNNPDVCWIDRLNEVNVVDNRLEYQIVGRLPIRTSQADAHTKPIALKNRLQCCRTQ